MSNSAQDAINYTGSSIMTLNCIVSGLASQLKATQGTEAVEAAQAYALKIADSYPTAKDVEPDRKAITAFFNAHK